MGIGALARRVQHVRDARRPPHARAELALVAAEEHEDRRARGPLPRAALRTATGEARVRGLAGQVLAAGRREGRADLAPRPRLRRHHDREREPHPHATRRASAESAVLCGSVINRHQNALHAREPSRIAAQGGDRRLQVASCGLREMVRLQVAGRLGRVLQVVGFKFRATGADSARNS